MSTGAPLPSSYQAHLHGNADDPGIELHGGDEGDDLDGELDDEGEEGDDVDVHGEGEGEDEDDGALESARLGEGEASAEEVQRLVDLGFDANEADQALRLSCNDPRRALALLRSGRVSMADEQVRHLQERLRSLPAFHALQQVVRVDPQIMLVLNTEAMRFEDPKADPRNAEGGADGAAADASQEREAVERAFWDACTLELTNVPPVYERTLQLVQEVRDTLCSLMPPPGTSNSARIGSRRADARRDRGGACVRPWPARRARALIHGLRRRPGAHALLGEPRR